MRPEDVAAKRIGLHKNTSFLACVCERRAIAIARNGIVATKRLRTGALKTKPAPLCPAREVRRIWTIERSTVGAPSVPSRVQKDRDRLQLRWCAPFGTEQPPKLSDARSKNFLFQTGATSAWWWLRASSQLWSSPHPIIAARFGLCQRFRVEAVGA